MEAFLIKQTQLRLIKISDALVKTYCSWLAKSA